MRQPLNPPSTSVGGPRLPAAVVADQESWKPSPRTSQQAFGHWSTVTFRLRRLDDVTVAVGPVVAAAAGAVAAGRNRGGQPGR
jgi:hypothetical protein